MQRSIGNAAVSRAIEQAHTAPRTGAHGAHSAHGAPLVQRAGWKNSDTAAATKTLKKATPAGDKQWVETLHHVIPRNRLSWLSSAVDPAQEALIKAQLGTLAPTAFTAHAGSLQEALENLPANYIVGPEPKTRNDDPDNKAHKKGRGGTGLADVNLDGNGQVTPRSKELDAADTWLIAQQTAAASAGSAFTINTHELQTQFIDKVKAASQLHGTAINLDKNRSTYGTDAAGHFRK
ncbi:hypothetical protein KGQ20_04440 [Catenulispora sp. NF23]|uniref:hypothetical protein n=1 Tax=Catenulispora pinistramenti TaxID=2705254 RepID=UPI001BA699AE|nr:hypothetical protein [Catenulispora pinistramenti]MBS2532011.1 hypothetical protein [Catenulispora pinistramenti]